MAQFFMRQPMPRARGSTMQERERPIMVQVTFLGTGAASSAGRTNIALLVQEADTQILLECGPNVLPQLQRAGTSADQIRFLFMSHRHGDHILGLPLFLLRRSMVENQDPLTVVATQDVIEAGQTLTRLVFPEIAARLLRVSWTEMPADRRGHMALNESIQLSTFPTPHTPEVASAAVRLDFSTSGRSLVYTGDTTFSEDLIDFSRECDLLVHEANFSEVLNPDLRASEYGHSTARQAGRAAALANCRLLALVHLSHSYAGREDQVRAEAAGVFGGEIIVPRDGATLFV
jgi:ribonuclease Z